MLGRMLFKEKQLRLCVVAVFVSGAPDAADALLLPPNPLSSSSFWDCQSDSNHRLCAEKIAQNVAYPIEPPAPTPRREPDTSKQLALPAFRPEPPIPEREVPAGMPIANSPEDGVISGLLRSPGNHYTLQWLAANDRNSLEQLKRRYPILRDAAVVQYQRAGKDWFVLLEGPFPSRTAAIAALESSPRAQMSRELYPWTRSIASIQKLDIVRPNQGNEILVDNLQQEYPAESVFEIPAAQPSIANTVYPTAPIQPLGEYLPPVQSSTPTQQTVVYGQEFDTPGYNSPGYQRYASDRGFPTAIEEPIADEMYASIVPAYRKRSSVIASGEVDYNHYQPEKSTGYQQDFNRYSDIEPIQKSFIPQEDILRAPSRNYTIEWMSSGRRSSLERAQHRYEEFKDAQIIHYQKYNRDRYVLVSKVFYSRRDAVGALSRPDLSRVSARLSPIIRQIGDLQKLVEQVPTHYRQTVKTEPVRYQRKTPRYQQPVRRSEPVQNRPIKEPAVRYARASSPVEKPAYNILANNYTIQWFAANNNESVEKMKRRFPELANARTVHFRRNQKDWFVLLQGDYKSSHEAIKAIKDPALKQAMLVLHPWTRPVDSLKKLQIVSMRSQ